MENYNISRSYSYSYSHSYSYGNDNTEKQIESYHGAPTRPQYNTSSYNLRSYSTSYNYNTNTNTNINTDNNKSIRVFKFQQGKSTVGPTLSKSWSLTDPELQRRKRVAGYKIYGVESKVKRSFRKSFRWIKDKYTRVVYGWY